MSGSGHFTVDDGNETLQQPLLYIVCVISVVSGHRTYFAFLAYQYAIGTLLAQSILHIATRSNNIWDTPEMRVKSCRPTCIGKEPLQKFGRRHAVLRAAGPNQRAELNVALHLSMWFHPLLKVPNQCPYHAQAENLATFSWACQEWSPVENVSAMLRAILRINSWPGCADLARRHALKKAPALKSPFLRGYAGMGSKKVSD